MTNLNFRVAQALTFGLLVFSTVLFANVVRGEENDDRRIMSVTTYQGSWAVPDNSFINYSDGSKQWCRTHRYNSNRTAVTVCN